jgi:hypothetical protein
MNILKKQKMKTKFLFIRMCWSVFFNQQPGWIFFRLTEKQQDDFLNSKDTDIDISIRYLGVDQRIIEKLAKRLSTKQREQ